MTILTDINKKYDIIAYFSYSVYIFRFQLGMMTIAVEDFMEILGESCDSGHVTLSSLLTCFETVANSASIEIHHSMHTPEIVSFSK